MRITVDAEGVQGAALALSPKHGPEVMRLWYDQAIKLIKVEMRAQAPTRLKSKVRHMTDGFIPPRWARVYVKSPLAHLIEGGTGSLGSSEFNHVAKHWPSAEGIMRQNPDMLPRQAYRMARAIGMRGGNPPQPFIAPTYASVKGRVEALSDQIANEVLK